MSQSNYYNPCCTQVNGNGLPTMYRQARLLTSGALVNLWLDASKTPAPSPSFIFYNPADSNCYELLSSDAPSSSPGNILRTWQAANQTGLFGLYCVSGGPPFAEARTCVGSTLMSLWKSLGLVTLPYYFLSGGVCGIIDGSSPTTSSPGALLSGEMSVSGCSDPSCTPAGYSYDTGGVNDPADGGVNQVTSATQTISVSGHTNIQWDEGRIDDFAFIIGTAESVTTVRDMTTGNTTITIPTDAVMIIGTGGYVNTNNAGNAPFTITVTDGTHSVVLTVTNAYGDYMSNFFTALSGAGFKVFNTGSPTALTNYSPLISGGTLSFKWVLVPFGSGQIQINSATLT